MSALARRLRKKRKKYKKNPSLASEAGSLFGEVMDIALPAGGGFLATRGLSKLAIAGIEKRWPTASKHAGALVPVGAFVALWWLGHKLKFLEKYHAGITAGSAIAAALNVLQTYMPKIGWLFGDPTLQTAGGTGAALASSAGQLPDNLETVQDDPSWYTYNDALDAGRYSDNGATKQQPQDRAANDPSRFISDDDDLGVLAGGLSGL